MNMKKAYEMRNSYGSHKTMSANINFIGGDEFLRAVGFEKRGIKSFMKFEIDVETINVETINIVIEVLNHKIFTQSNVCHAQQVSRLNEDC